MNHDELVNLFKQMQARPGMYFHRGVEFSMLVGYVYGLIECGVSELKGFQSWISQSFSGWPTSPICWEGIIIDSIINDEFRWNLTEDENVEALNRTLSSLIAYCEDWNKGSCESTV